MFGTGALEVQSEVRHGGDDSELMTDMRNDQILCEKKING